MTTLLRLMLVPDQSKRAEPLISEDPGGRRPRREIREIESVAVFPSQRLKQLADQLHGFRKQVAPARNKLISHADRSAILAGAALGAATPAAWRQFWRDLEEFVSII
jgi:hypothetical protein